MSAATAPLEVVDPAPAASEPAPAGDAAVDVAAPSDGQSSGTYPAGPRAEDPSAPSGSPTSTQQLPLRSPSAGLVLPPGPRPSVPSIAKLPEHVRRVILDGEADVPSLLGRPHLISRFINRMAGRDDRNRLERLSWEQLLLEDNIDLVRFTARKRETYNRARDQEKKLEAALVTIANQEEKRRETNRELDTERERRLEAEESGLRTERERDLAVEGRAEAEAALSAAEEARATAEEALGAALETKEAAEEARASAEAGRAASEEARRVAEEALNKVRADAAEGERRLLDEIERLKRDHADALSQARRERFEVLAQEDFGLELGVAYFGQGFDFCKQKVAQKFPDADLEDIQPGN